jgi:hypothetical protein
VIHLPSRYGFHGDNVSIILQEKTMDILFMYF